MIRGRTELLPATCERWQELLDLVPHDVYHTAGYHSTLQLGRDGEAFLFTYREGDRTFLWPYLLAPIVHPSLGTASSFYDVTSVYGYAGPVASADPGFAARAWRELVNVWHEQGVVSAFTRFHPILGNSALSEYFIEESVDREEGSLACGQTVSIDLTLDPAEQVHQYQKVLRQQIRKAREAGLTTHLDTEWEHEHDFIRIYRETMVRRESRSEYLVDAQWLTQFRERLGPAALLFVTKYDGVIASALLAMRYGPYLHAHLTGSSAAAMRFSPLKLLLDDVRQWGTQEGLRFFHLGGGLGGQKDSLFEFKRKYSPTTHDFRIGRWILREQEYRELAMARRESLTRQGLNVADDGFFPAYRYTPEPDLIGEIAR